MSKRTQPSLEAIELAVQEAHELSGRHEHCWRCGECRPRRAWYRRLVTHAECPDRRWCEARNREFG